MADQSSLFDRVDAASPKSGEEGDLFSKVDAAHKVAEPASVTKTPTTPSTVMSDADWAKLSAAEKFLHLVEWAGNIASGLFLPPSVTHDATGKLVIEGQRLGTEAKTAPVSTALKYLAPAALEGAGTVFVSPGGAAAVKAAAPAVGAAGGAYEGYKRDGVFGALRGGAYGAASGYGLSKLTDVLGGPDGAIMNALRRLKLAPEAAAVAPTVEDMVPGSSPSLVTPANAARNAAQGARMGEGQDFGGRVASEALNTLLKRGGVVAPPSSPEGGGFTVPPTSINDANIGGRVTTPTAPRSLEDELLDTLTAMRAPGAKEIPFSHPVGGGFTTPPPVGANAGGRLNPTVTPRPSTPSVAESLMQALTDLRAKGAAGPTEPPVPADPRLDELVQKFGGTAAPDTAAEVPTRPNVSRESATEALASIKGEGTTTNKGVTMPIRAGETDMRKVMFGGATVNDPLRRFPRQPLTTQGHSVGVEYDPNNLERMKEMLDLLLRQRK